MTTTVFCSSRRGKNWQKKVQNQGLQVKTGSIPLYLALVHYPVVNRRHEVIASAVTNLDLHDLARLTRTYDLPGCFIVTPLQDQQELVQQLLGHWRDGLGRELHPQRWQALERLRVVDDIQAACAAIAAEAGSPPVLWATSAREAGANLSHWQAHQLLLQSVSQPAAVYLLLLGTAWGLDASVLEACTAVLEPIAGTNDYNHLSVRCAAAILVDRLVGERAAPSGCADRDEGTFETHQALSRIVNSSGH